MLAQLNSKQKSLFFNIKPTVIDKLISKNKSSIQNNLLYTNEDSDGSLSEESEESSTSSQESNFAESEQNSETMAPVRRSEKMAAMGSRLSSRSQFPMKRGVGRPKTQVVRNATNLKVMAAKKVLENSKRGSNKKIVVRDVRSVNVKRNGNEVPSTSTKHSRNSIKKESTSPNVSEEKKTTLKRRQRAAKDLKPVSVNDSKSNFTSSSSSMALISTKSSPRKFPSNVVDRWKSTGMVIRGRGRPRGSTRGVTVSYRGRGASYSGRGSFRGRGAFKLGTLRTERYVTRDSQIGLMRSGKRRKCSNSELVAGLERSRKKRRVRVKTEKSDYPSDEHSSFITTSELSYCENDNSVKQSDDEIINPKVIKVKEEIKEEILTEDEAASSRDTNSNVFKSIKIKNEPKISSSGSDTNDQSDNCKSVRQNLSMGPKSIGRGKKRLLSLGRKVISLSDSSVRDSDCSMDSDITGSSKSGVKRQRRRADGIWVRRSVRSVGKSNDKSEPDTVVIEEILKNKDSVVNIESNSNSSLTDNVNNDNLPPAISSAETKLPKQINSSESVIETPLKENISNCNEVCEFQGSDNNATFIDLVNDFDRSEPKTALNTDERSVIKDDSITDSKRHFGETSLNKSNLLPEIPTEYPLKENFEQSTNGGDDIIKNFTSVDSSCTSSPTAVATLTERNTEIQCEINTKEIKTELNSSEFTTNMSQKTSSGSDNKTNQTLFLDKQESIKPIIIGVDNKTKGCLKNSVDTFNDQVCNDREIISDEKILSMIDSFCSQSDTTDFSTDEATQESTSVESEEKIILESVNKITHEVENKLLVETGLQKLTATINSLSGEIVNKCLESKTSEQTTSCEIINTREPIESKIKENTLSDQSKSSDLEVYKENKDIFEGNNNENADSAKVFKDKFASCYENVEKIEINLDKAPEITEDSSSSDSNSNLSELMSSLENESGIRNEHVQPQCEIQENKLTVLIKEEGESIISKETDQTLPVIHQNNSTVHKSDMNNQVEANKEITHTTMPSRKSSTEESLEERPSKELLSALGLQSLHSITEEKPKRPNESYTGTLKAVIKLNRSSDKRHGGRKMIFKQGDKLSEDAGGGDRLEYRICNAEEISTEGVPLTHLADIPANRKSQLKVKSQFDLSSNLNIVGSSGSTEASSDSTGGKQNLIIPEKSSSFSIHPERLCTDVCSYCFGKFGSLDTPCHLAQLKNAERQAKILAIEVHLSADSCLCDGCFRYVDRKANCPTAQRSRKPAARRGPLAGTICAVQECNQPARHSVRRKWLVKLKKSIGKKLVIDMDKNPHLPFPLCSQHYYWVDYFTVCGICKKRLTRNHMYALGPEAEDLNQALCDDGIPVRLSDKLFLCKLCRYYSSLRLKCRDPSAMSSTHRLFLNSYRKKILKYHDIPVSDSEDEGKSVEEEGASSEPPKSKKKKSKSKSLDGHDSKKRSTDKESKIDHVTEDRSNDSQMIDYSYLDTLNIHREEPTTSTVDYSAIGDFEGQVGFSNIASFLNPLETGQGTVYPPDSQNRSRVEKPTRIQVKFGNLNIGKLSNLNIGQDSRPATSVTPTLERPPYLPGERDLKLAGEFEFHGTLNPSSGWERCTSTIQFDQETKKLWQELQRPYGNQSSFLRHLVILEKHWRNGSLVLAENANPRAVKYITSVKNRVQAYDGAKSSNVPLENQKQPEKTVTSPPPRPMSTPLKSTPPPLMKITPGSTPWLHEQLKKPPSYSSSITSTYNRLVQTPAPPPYRLPKLGPHPIRLSSPSPSLKNQQNTARPVSISYQQFKKIRLEQPPVSVGQVTVVPKVEPSVDNRTPSSEASTSGDFTPLICDVRSLASPTTDWNESFRKQQQKMLKQNIAKYYTPILPKIPNSLTVTTFPQTTALVMKTSSLTIEKAPNVNAKPTFITPEKPSISVFRETTPSDNG